ncbi:hypothetical protein LCGC14_0525850 [marine sediment metagenome]|uniref:Thiazole biosynthesis enzyme n=1 Tax=marine sediment metagenome TaxID=412755 RepID=A0A0F9UIG0_9ZZZZ
MSNNGNGSKKVNQIFSPVREADITRTITEEFLKDLSEYAETDVAIVGAGPSGLIAAKELAEKGIKVLVIESNNYLGGGFWIGGYLMNKVTFRKPAEKVLDELGITYSEAKENLYVTDGPLACSKLISAACESGVKVLNATKFEDSVVKDGKVSGVVVNWNAVSALPRAITCVDPIALEAKVVIDATGHDAWVAKSLEDRNILELPGCGTMWVEKSEDEVVNKTGEIFPGLIVAGMATATVYGIPRMGPTFGGMLLSGKKAAEVALEKLKAEELVTV